MLILVLSITHKMDELVTDIWRNIPIEMIVEIGNSDWKVWSKIVICNSYLYKQLIGKKALMMQRSYKKVIYRLPAPFTEFVDIYTILPNGVKQGEEKTWFEYGDRSYLRYICQRVDGKKHGDAFEWTIHRLRFGTDDHYMHCIAKYNHGILLGFESYNRAGVMTERGEYIGNNLIMHNV
ncbi:hypothetical protein E24_00493 [Faustovirus]|nr:hypothetical protein E24_00493 [Faustovirus]AMN84388.1 hypothetical protein D5a_00491 [Faustovirus]